MRKEYWFIIIGYIVMQLSGIVMVPFIYFIGQRFDMNSDISTITVIWLIISFILMLIFTLFMLRKEMRSSQMDRGAASVSSSIKWATGGIFLAYFSQVLAASIESFFRIEMSSDNTQQILGIIEAFPVFVIVSSIIGPILEEIVFRKIIFGSLHKRLNFFLSALISSIIFGLVHGEIEHLLLYSAMGFTFAYLYVKTKRIIVPIFAHVAMNTIVVLLQTVFKDDIERLIQEFEKNQGVIWGLFI